MTLGQDCGENTYFFLQRRPVLQHVDPFFTIQIAPISQQQSRQVPQLLTASLEYLIPPSDKAAYYGISDYLTELPAESFQSTEMMLKLAENNKLILDCTIGTVIQAQPPELQAETGNTAVEFTLTGGLGYTPITVHGLSQPNGWQLQQNGVPVNQAVEGNDYWQAYSNADTGTFSLFYNVQNRGTNTYRLIRLTD